MPGTLIDLIGGFYTDDSLPWSCQDTVNLLPVRAEVEGTRTPTKLTDAPGLKPSVFIGNYETDPVPSGPIRGMHDVEGKLFVVSGSTLYQISNAGVAIPRGTIPGTGRVSMAHNQIAGGNQLIAVNGSSGYVWNTVTLTFQKVVDSGYPGASIAEFIYGYLVQLEPFGRFILHSDLADALAYNMLDRFEAETAPDMTNGLAILHQEVWALGERTIDVFENVGTATGTFRNKGVSIAKGCMARWSTSVIDNGLAWLGHDGVVYHARGYDPTRISTRAIEVALSECSETDRRNAFAFVWEDRGHSVYYLTVPNGQTFGYDFSTGLWHRRASWHPIKDISGRWRLSDLVRSNGKWIGGDYQSGRLYALDWEYPLESCDPLIRERTSAVAHNNGARFTVDEVEVLFDTGAVEAECVPFPYQPQGPRITGDAPNAGVGRAYTFTYTVTPGDAPIATTAITSGTLLAGLTWNAATATISGTPTVTGTMNLTFRTYDTSGLYDDHADTIEITGLWLITYPPPGGSGGSVKISRDVDDWGVTPINPNNSWYPGNASITHVGGSVILATSVPNSGDNVVSSNDYGLTWTSSSPGIAANGHRCIAIGGFVNIAANSSDGTQRTSVDGAFSWSTIASGGKSEAIGRIGDKLVVASRGADIYASVRTSTNFGASFTAAGDLGQSDNIVVGDTATGYQDDDETLAIFGFISSGTDRTAVCVHSLTANSGSWIRATLPLPMVVSGTGLDPVATYLTGPGLWVVAFFNRIAYGADLDALTLSAHVFDENILCIGTDGEIVVVGGDDGFMERSFDMENWTPIASGVADEIIGLTYFGATP